MTGFASSVNLSPTDGVVVVPLGGSADVAAAWDQWSVDHREIWAAQINELATHHHLVAKTRRQRGDEPDDVGLSLGPTQHPSFPQPKDLDAALWRYLSADKFVSLIEARSLWFSRSDQLGDTHEGARSRVNLDRASEIYPDAPVLRGTRPVDSAQEVYVNCWHMAAVESVAMWGMYTNPPDGVAIRTTYRKLQGSLPHGRSVYVGLVTYVDYGTTWIPEANLFDRFMRKRVYFEYEREVRAVFTDWTRAPRTFEPGMLVPVDLSNLIDEIVVAPGASDSFVREVTRRTRGAGLRSPIRRSDIDADPIR